MVSFSFFRSPLEKLKTRIQKVKNDPNVDTENYILEALLTAKIPAGDVGIAFLLNELLATDPDLLSKHCGQIPYLLRNNIDITTTNGDLVKKILAKQEPKSLLPPLKHPCLYENYPNDETASYFMAQLEQALEKSEPETTCKYTLNAMNWGLNNKATLSKFVELHKKAIQKLMEKDQAVAIEEICKNLNLQVVAITPLSVKMACPYSPEQKEEIIREFLLPLTRERKDLGITLHLLSEENGISLPELKKEFEESAEKVRAQQITDIHKATEALEEAKVQLEIAKDMTTPEALKSYFITALNSPHQTLSAIIEESRGTQQKQKKEPILK